MFLFLLNIYWKIIFLGHLELLIFCNLLFFIDDVNSMNRSVLRVWIMEIKHTEKKRRKRGTVDIATHRRNIHTTNEILISFFRPEISVCQLLRLLDATAMFCFKQKKSRESYIDGTNERTNRWINGWCTVCYPFNIYVFSLSSITILVERTHLRTHYYMFFFRSRFFVVVVIVLLYLSWIVCTRVWP